MTLRTGSERVYARAHDQTVADDYFTAMERVEQRLEIIPLPVQEPQEEKEYEVVKVPERAQLLVWVERLALPELCHEERLGIVKSLKQALLLVTGNEHPPPVATGVA